MIANLIDKTHAIGGIRVAERPRRAVRRGGPVVIVPLADGSEKVYPVGRDVEVTGWTEPFQAGPVKALVGGQRIDYAERTANFTVSRNPR